MIKSYDWIVIGSGPGGFVASTELSKKYSVLLIEKGGIPNSNKYSSEISINELYDDISVVKSQSPFGFGQGSCLGGGSVVNGALFWPLPIHTENHWRKEFGDKFVDDIKDNYSFYKSLLNVSTDSVKIGNKDSLVMKAAAEKLGWKVVPVPRALNNCELNNNCGFGCESKVSLDKLYSKYNDINIKVNSNVSKIIMKKSKAIGVTLTSGENIYVKKGIIVAAGALNSHSILKSSNIKSKSFPQFHINLKFVVEHTDELNSSYGTMFTHQVQEFIDDKMLVMPTNFSRKSLLSSTLHLNKNDRKYIFNNRKKCGIYVLQLQPATVGKIKRIFGKDYFFYQLNDNDFDLIFKSVRRTIHLLKNAGFKKIVIPSKKLNKLFNLETFDESIINNVFNWDFISVHGMSANRIGKSPNDSICNTEGLVHNTSNVFVSDSSCLPSNIGESPQGVIMSNAKRIVDQINL